MLTTKNNSKKVLVLKSVRASALRLLPGFNHVELENLNIYTDNNPAAKALVKEHLSVINPADVTAAEKTEADKAKKKNDKLNKSASLLKKAQDNLLKAEDKFKTEKEKSLASDLEIEKLKSQLKDMQIAMKELMATKSPEKDKK